MNEDRRRFGAALAMVGRTESPENRRAARIRSGREVRVSLGGCLAAGRKTSSDARPVLENSTACQVVDAMNVHRLCGRVFDPVVAVDGSYWLLQTSSTSVVGVCLVSSTGPFGGHFVSRFPRRFGGAGLIDIYGEFDSGSGRTLAACLTHASRTVTSGLALVDQWRTGE